ncbi:MAG: chromosome segregation protein SMC, partial [Clostridia bacterium]|nr:chromosome segregation protein SMC [Clostridia bacterium]
INTYIFRHDGAAGEREKIDARITKINSQIKHNSELAASLLAEYEKCRGLLAGADDRLKRLNEERLEYTVGLERSTGESKVFKERANAVKYKLQQAQDDIVFATKRIGDVDKGIRRCEEYAGKNGERIEKLRETCAQLQADIVRLTESIASYELSTNEHRKKVMDAFRDLSEIKENIGSLSAKKELLKERLAEMDDAMQTVRAEHEKLKAEYDKTLKAQESLNSYLGDENVLMENAAAAVTAASDKVQALVRKIYDSEAQISSLQQSLRTYTALRDRFEGYVYSVRRLMSDAKENSKLSSRIMGLIADVVSCDKGYEIAIETAFGGAMQNVITETREDAQFLIEYLKSNRAGQVTFLPIDALRPRLESAQIKSACSERGAVGLAIDLVRYDKKYDNVIHNLLGNTLVCEDIACATVIARRYPRAFKIVTLDGDIIATSGSMTGGSRRENSANLLANERKIKEIEDEIALRKNTLSTAENKRAEAESDLKKAREEREALDGKLQQARLELAAAKEKLSSLTFNIADKESEYSVYRQSKAQVEEKLAELDSEYSSTSKGASTLSEQSTKATSEIDSLSEENDKIVKERNDKAARLNALQVEIASLESAMKSNMDSAERTKAEKAELIERVSNLRTLLPELQKQFDEWNEKAARAALTKDEQVKLDDLNERIAEVEKSKKQLNDRVAEIDKSRFETAELLEDLNNKLHNQEMAMQKIDSDLEFLQQRIEEEYHEDYEGCLKYKVENFDVGAASSVIINCKRQITMIGAVNPTAIEDYEAVSTRYQRMTEERQDLEKAIADLEHALE